ncbi:MAG: penicillin-binding protein 2, partial [Candidatus Omnitrophica bacterium]|nr:penicillin-binding protein 2 [Candidatus Omnitrophota bacterium]
GGSLIVMDPHTGEILALAHQPGVDPNQPAEASADARRNRAVTDIMEPGSVFKIVAASALLEEGLVRLDERIFCEQGQFRTVARHILHDHTPHGWLAFKDVIAYSSNIGTAKASQRLTPDALYRYIRAFGFGRKTAVELPGEVNGIVPPPARWSKLSPFIIPIGQEVAVTPLQLAVMTAVIANGGWRVSPHLVARVQDAQGEVIRAYEAPARERVVRAETAAQVEQMLISAVESGTGRLANVQGLTVAGKTGTAQKLEPNGRYSHSRYVASFVGYGPVPDSRFVIVVTVDEPRPQYFGGTVAAPIFQRAVDQLKGYWRLMPAVRPNTLARLP